MSGDEIRDLTDDEARRALPLKWGSGARGHGAGVGGRDGRRPGAGHRGRGGRRGAAGTAGYPPFGDAGVGAALAGFAGRHWDQDLPRDATVIVGDVIAGIRLALDVLCPPGRSWCRSAATRRSATWCGWPVASW